VVDQGWSVNSIGFGSGGGLLQKMNRDTQKCAFKCSYAVVDFTEIDVQKVHKLALARVHQAEWLLTCYCVWTVANPRAR
jgi:hypothetical protein